MEAVLAGFVGSEKIHGPVLGRDWKEFCREALGDFNSAAGRGY